MWHSSGPHYCASCKPIGVKKLQPVLELINQNYSGCGVDIGKCPNCDKYYQISYKVDKIIDITDEVTKNQRRVL